MCGLHQHCRTSHPSCFAKGCKGGRAPDATYAHAITHLPGGCCSCVCLVCWRHSTHCDKATSCARCAPKVHMVLSVMGASTWRRAETVSRALAGCAVGAVDGGFYCVCLSPVFSLCPATLAGPDHSRTWCGACSCHVHLLVGEAGTAVHQRAGTVRGSEGIRSTMFPWGCSAHACLLAPVLGSTLQPVLASER